ncbi:MAG: carbamate kinase [Caldisericia bacterium]|nr:carbamate kinase [Caldisericia bacterium]
MRIVLAIGGNSLIKNKKENRISDQYNQVKQTVQSMQEVVLGDNEIVITHGNGPQVGFLLQMQEKMPDNIPTMPIDYCVANTQGGIGYQIQCAIQNQLSQHSSSKKVVSIVTQCEVEENDTAFQHPTKPIGSFFSYEDITHRAKEYGWKFVEDSGRGYRRVVASPKPTLILEKDIIRTLLQNNTIVIATGGGGIPVIRKGFDYIGIEAVIDKDFASSLLAQEINADLLVISTGVPYVSLDFGTPQEKPLRDVPFSLMKEYLSQNHFGKGSMEPKIIAGLQFTESTGKPTIITSPENIQKALEGKTGTKIIPNS